MKLSDLVQLSGGFQPGAGSSVSVAHARKVIDAPDASLKKVTVLFDSQRRCRPEDDMRLEDGDVVTVQGTGENGTFSRGQLTTLLDLAEAGIDRLKELQAPRIIMRTLRACPDRKTAAWPAELTPPTTMTSCAAHSCASMAVAP